MTKGTLSVDNHRAKVADHQSSVESEIAQLQANMPTGMKLKESHKEVISQKLPQRIELVRT